MIKGIKVFACACLFYSHVIAQPASLPKRDIRFEQLPQELGLSQRSVNDIIQDCNGYLWIATWSGLLRYDGYETILFNADNSDENALKSNKITSLYQTSDSTIWVGTMVGGLYRLEPGQSSFTQYIKNDDPNSISDNNIWDMIEDKAGYLWVATQHGLNRMDRAEQRFDHYFSDPADSTSITYDFVTGLSVIEDQLWVTTEDGVNSLSLSNPDDGFRHYYFDAGTNDLLENYAYESESLVIDGRVFTFWATKKGLKVFDGERIRSFDVEGKSSSFSFLRSLWIVDGDQPFVILGSEMGISLFDISQMRFTNFFGDFNEEVNLSQNTISALYIDQSGVLWVGTKKGINKFDTYNNNFSLIETSTFDPTNSIITCMVSDTEGNPWISTLGGGLFKMIKDKHGKPQMVNYQIIDAALADLTNFVQKLSVDATGNFWAGTAGAGVYVFDPLKVKGTRITNYQKFAANGPGSISDNYVMSMKNATSGGMWVGTWSQGLNKIEPSGQVYRYAEPWLEQSPIVTIFQKNNETLWLGTRGKGLLKIKLKDEKIVAYQHFQTTTDSTSLSNDFINTIYEDSNKRLWIGTEDGLNLYHEPNHSFQRYKKTTGLTNAEVVSILEDNRGLFWLTHFNGISVLDPNKKENVLINDFDVKDRVQGGFFYNEVAMKGADDKLYFGGSNGFNIIGGHSVYENPHIPRVVIQKMSVFNQEILSGEMLNERIVLTKPIEQTHAITLAYDENSISFEFTALHFAIPEKNKYAYILEGFDDGWQYTSADRRIATYTNLKEGQYTFQVKASNDDGVWNEQPTMIKVVILPPWWRTHQAFFGYALLGALLLLLFRKLILIRLDYENEIKFERIARENNEHLNKSKLQFFTNISHEFRTPLTLILGPIERLINSGEGGHAIQQQLKMVERSANRLQRLINQLLDFRKADAGNLGLHVAAGNFYKFIKEIKLSFDTLASDRNIDFQLHTSANVIELYFDRDQMEKVIYNLLSNAFKHAPSQGSVALDLLEHNSHIELIIMDNGVGIPTAEIDQVFDRFFTGEGEAGDSSGIGLALCKSLVELHKGTIQVESEENVSTRFIVRLPKGKDHFQEDQMISDFKDSEDVTKYIEHANQSTHQEIQEEKGYTQNLSEMSRILIVEDNDQVRSFIKSIFQYDYVVLEAENGEIGFQVANEENPNIIISDVMMPEMDGFTLCTALKENLSTSHIPIVLLTARTSYIYQVEGLEKGADDYITKPFSPEILKLKVKNLLQSREQSRALARSNKTLAIEPKKITVTSADELFMTRAIEYVEDNISNAEFTVVEFGKEIGLSRMQLYRKLKAITGLSPNEFIRMMRVKRAAQLLEQGDFNVSEVTYQVGFTDPTYLRKCFKQQFGVTPSEYAKTNKN